MTDIFEPAQLENALKLEAHLLETALFINDGRGVFSRISLPVEVQFSPVMAIQSGDFNGDGFSDLLMGGNLHRVKPEVGRYDASYGNLLLGDGKNGFHLVPPMESGIRLEGEVRDFTQIAIGEKAYILVARNNEDLQAFKILKP